MMFSPETVADILRVAGILLGGMSFGAAVVIYRQLPAIWKKEDLLVARMFVVAHLLVVLFVAGALAEHQGDELSWRTPLALMVFTLKGAMLAILRERLNGMNLRLNPPARRAQDLTGGRDGIDA